MTVRAQAGAHKRWDFYPLAVRNVGYKFKDKANLGSPC